MGWTILCRERDFFVLYSVQSGYGAQALPIQWVDGAFSPGINRPGREAYRWPAPSAKFKYAWSYTATSSYVCLLAWLTALARICFRRYE
jgi:hypothetical protein